MRFGVREICDVVFKPLTSVDIGDQHFDAMQPVLYLDTAKTSTLEGASTTVYAQGGKGNPRLIGWDGEKTLTFTVEDALMSPVSFAMLSGAGIVKGVGENDNTATDKQKVYVHKTYDLVVEGAPGAFYAKLPQDVRDGATLIATKEAPIYATILDSAGAQKYFLSAIGDQEIFENAALSGGINIKDRGVINVAPDADLYFKLTSKNINPSQSTNYTDSPTEVFKAGDAVRIDCYAVYGNGAQELQIDAEHFAGYYYIEASTLFRDESTGRDFPAEFIIPRGKIQSNFTFTMANSGDPSTFTFTIDAFPAYTKFNKGKKVMAALQILDPEAEKHNYADKSIIGHENRDNDEQAYDDEYDNSIFDQIDASDVESPIVGPTLKASSKTQFGAPAYELQSGISVSGKTIRGTVKYYADETTELVDYWNPGYFLALDFDIPEGVDPSLITVAGSQLDADKTGVWLVGQHMKDGAYDPEGELKKATKIDVVTRSADPSVAPKTETYTLALTFAPEE